MHVWIPALAVLMACGIGAARLDGPAAAAIGAQRGFDLGRLKAPSSDSTPSDRAGTLVSLLREEVNEPSPPRQGFAGWITHDYILAQIVRWGVHAKADLESLRQASRSSHGELSDCLRLARGLLGDRESIPFLVEYLGDTRRTPYLRNTAAEALVTMPDGRAVAVLTGCLADPYWEPSGCLGPARRIYLIRMTARFGLRRFAEQGIPVPDSVLRALERVVTEEPYLPPPRGGRP